VGEVAKLARYLICLAAVLSLVGVFGVTSHFAAERCSRLDRLAKHCAGGDMRNVPFPAELACLRALAGARRAEHHQIQFHAEVSGVRFRISGGIRVPDVLIVYSR